MKIYLCFILGILCFPLSGFSKFSELGKQTEFLEKENFSFSNTNLRIIQKRWLEKHFLSEISLSVSPALKGFNYLESYSTDFSYRFFINNHFSLKLIYSSYFNAINQEGYDEIELRVRYPIEILHAQNQSYLLGFEWYPFYGKAVLYNKLVHFDLYFSILGGQIELWRKNNRQSFYSFSIGLAQWWHKNFNTRLSIQSFYYQYDSPYYKDSKDLKKEFVHKISFSAGALF
ncbi:MAG: hypothetical protein OXC37_03815 [Bdellovibrionaceae bacterium]|nr:hypothetical protein [Pseudobdellovibrionaceae bacterium]